MSRVCKYYLRGTCKYGARCHFLHDDPYGGNNNSAYNSINKNTSQNYYNQRNGYAENYATNYTNNSGGDYRSRSGASSLKSNYERYHIDNRRNQNQREGYNSPNPSEITAADFLELINMELKQFELCHMWPLTVISPLKDLGNIPGFRDCSPEEIRFQYYQAVSNGTVDQFEQAMKQIYSEMVKCCQVLKMKSNEAFNIAKTMLQQPRSAEISEMSGSCPASSISAFSFNLNNLHDNKSAQLIDTMSVGGTAAAAGSNSPFTLNVAPSFPNSNANAEASSFYTATQNQQYQCGSAFAAAAFNNQSPLSTAFGVGNIAPAQVDGQSQINNFSFNVANLRNDLNAPPSSFNRKNDSNGAPCSYNLRNDLNSTASLSNNFTDNAKSTGEGTCGVYSELSQLPANMLESFQEKTFKLGGVPLMPPPRQLCFSSSFG